MVGGGDAGVSGGEGVYVVSLGYNWVTERCRCGQIGI